MEEAFLNIILLNSIHFSKIFFARSLFDTKPLNLTTADISLKVWLLKYNQIESTEDRANTVLHKNEWTLPTKLSTLFYNKFNN